MPMRPTQVTLSAAGFSPWVPLNRMSNSFGIGLGVKLSSGASLTYSVQHTFDDIYAVSQDFSVARVTTTATVTKTNHGLSVGDWVLIYGNRDDQAWAPLVGEFTVASVVDANNFTYTVANTGAASIPAGAGKIQTARVFTHETLAAQTTSQDGNYQFPPRATRLVISSYASGIVTLDIIAAGK